MSVSWNGKTDEGQNNATEGRVQMEVRMEGQRDDKGETTNEGPEAAGRRGDMFAHGDEEGETGTEGGRGVAALGGFC